MKAPSTLGLRALRIIVYQPSLPAQCLHVSRKCYATTSAKRPSREPQSRAIKSSATSNPAKSSSSLPPSPVSRAPPESGHIQGKAKGDDDEFVPQPLSRPIGFPDPPQTGTNRGRDSRTLVQRRNDFVNYDKHLARRATMTAQMAKPYFRDWSNMRFQKGKVFVAPPRLFKPEHALFFPNFFGRTLQAAAESLEKSDGYGGLGRDTCDVMYGKVSIVSIAGNAWAANQTASFVEDAAVTQLVSEHPEVLQQVEINLENNVLKYYLLQLFGMRRLRRDRSLEQQDRYFIVRRGVSAAMKEAIGLLNDKGGYVYLVDADCKIRWAGSAIADEKEKESMVKGLRRLIQEAKIIAGELVDSDSLLQSVVAEVVEGSEKKAAAA